VDDDFCTSFLSLLKERKKDLIPNSSKTLDQSQVRCNAATAAITVEPPIGRLPSFVSPSVGAVFHFHWKRDEMAKKAALSMEDVTFDMDLGEHTELDPMDEVLSQSDAPIAPHPPPVVAAASDLLLSPQTAGAIRCVINDNEEDDDDDLYDDLFNGIDVASSTDVEESGDLGYMSVELNQSPATITEVQMSPLDHSRPKKPLPRAKSPHLSIPSDTLSAVPSYHQLSVPDVPTTEVHPEDDVGISQSAEQISRRKVRGLPGRKPNGTGKMKPEASRALSTSNVDSTRSCSSTSSSSSGSDMEMLATPLDALQPLPGATPTSLVLEPEAININTGSYQTDATGLDRIFGADSQSVISKAPSAEMYSPPVDFNFLNNALNSFAHPTPISVVTDITGRQMVVQAPSNPAPQPSFTLPLDLSTPMSQNTAASLDFSLPMLPNMVASFDFPNPSLPSVPDFGPLPSTDLPVQTNPIPQLDLANTPLTDQLQALMGLNDVAFANLLQQFPPPIPDSLPTTINPIHTLNDPFSNLYGWSSQPTASVMPTSYLSEFIAV
jgi:hypothetical protein